MDQRAEKLCCTGNCMYSMSDVPCLRKMGNADKIKNRPLFGVFVLILQSAPPPLNQFSASGCRTPPGFPEGITPLDLFRNPTANYRTFIFIHVQNLYLSLPLLLWQRMPLLSNSFELISSGSKFGHSCKEIYNKGTFFCDEGEDEEEKKTVRSWGAQTENTFTAQLMGYWKYSSLECELFTYRNGCELCTNYELHSAWNEKVLFYFLAFRLSLLTCRLEHHLSQSLMHLNIFGLWNVLVKQNWIFKKNIWWRVHSWQQL